jgi:hypothetical protein
MSFLMEEVIQKQNLQHIQNSYSQVMFIITATARFHENVRGHGGKSPRYLNIEEAVTNRI